MDECTYEKPKKQSRSACDLGVYLECQVDQMTEFRGPKRKVNSAGVAYAGVFYVDGRAVCDDGLWDDGMKTNDIKKQGLICAICRYVRPCAKGAKILLRILLPINDPGVYLFLIYF